MKRLLLIGFLLIYQMTFGQQRLLSEFGNDYYSPDLYYNKYDAPEGSPYLDDTFLPARINDIKETQLVRLDAYEGRVEVKLSPSRVVILDSETYYLIALNDGSDRVFETLGYLDNKGESKYSFFERMYEGDNYKLYRREIAKYFKEEKAQGYQEAKPARFKLTDKVFYIKHNPEASAKLVEIPDRLKDFRKSFPEQEKAIRDLIKKENLKLDKADDLTRIFDLYYSKS